MRRILAILAAGFLALLAVPSGAQQADQPSINQAAAQPLADGLSQFTFDDWQGPAIEVFAFVPEGVDRANAPIMMMMHGAERDAERYLREWMPFAQRDGFIVIAPKFSRPTFDTSRQYNMGWINERDDEALRPEELWSFSAIEPLFDLVVARLGGNQRSYALYGHSAGSQFVHRFLFLKPDARVSRYMAANAGWYSYPDLTIDFPFGLRGTGLDEDDVRAALAKDVVIILGDEDTDRRDDALNRSDEAMAQGPHRYARGLNFIATARDLAAERGWDFGWRLQVVEGVAHSNGGIAAASAVLVTYPD